MKVRSFAVGLDGHSDARWAEIAVKKLDQKVKMALGEKITIHSVRDEVHRAHLRDSAMVRIVVYDD